MPEIPPDNSIVTIRSYFYGTYISACEDHKSVRLEKVDDPKQLPQNCLWRLQTKPLMGYSIASLRFISCYGRHLALKGFFRPEIGQDNPVTGYTRFWFAGWNYDRVGTTYCLDGFRLVVGGKFFLSAKKNGQVSFDHSPLYLCTEPEVYWTIKQVRNKDDVPMVNEMPRELRSRSDGIRVDDDDRPEPRGGKGIALHFDVSINNNPMAINTGGNVNNGRGEQRNGGVKAANTKKQYVHPG